MTNQPGTDVSHTPVSQRRQRGFTYAMVLVAVVVLAIFAEVATTTTMRAVQTEREAELLFRGQAYMRAVQSYYEAGTAIKVFPRSLEDLVKDPRFAQKHHLRALYADPMAPRKDNAAPDQKATGAEDWRLIRAADGGISGVASRSTAVPLRSANFPKGLEKFESAKSYADWVFEYKPPLTAPPAAATPTKPSGPSPVQTF